MTTLHTAVELPEQSTRARGGLLAAALPAPDGWQRGIAVPFYGCGEPILRDKCIAAIDVPHRTSIAEFSPFPVEQGATCSTLSQIPQEDHALARLDATTEWAVGRQLATDVVGNGNPSFADATNLGAVVLEADFINAVACLEQAAADTGFGTRWWLHAPIRAAAHLAYQGLLTIDGLSPSGARWVLSPGYPVQGATTIRLWATGPVWAAVDGPDVHSAVDFRTNDDTAFALRSAIAAFDPCLNLSIDVPVIACPTPA